MKLKYLFVITAFCALHSYIARYFYLRTIGIMPHYVWNDCSAYPTPNSECLLMSYALSTGICVLIATAIFVIYIIKDGFFGNENL